MLSISSVIIQNFYCFLEFDNGSFPNLDEPVFFLYILVFARIHDHDFGQRVLHFKLVCPVLQYLMNQFC